MDVLGGISLTSLRLAFGLGVSLLAICAGLVCGVRVMVPAVHRLWTQQSAVLPVTEPTPTRLRWPVLTSGPSIGFTVGVVLCYPLLIAWPVATAGNWVVSAIGFAAMAALAVLAGVLPVARTGRMAQGLLAGLLLGATNGITALEVAFRWSQETAWFGSAVGALYVHLLPPLAGFSLLLICALCASLVAASR